MKKTCVLALLFLFSVAVVAPAFATTQEPQKVEKVEKKEVDQDKKVEKSQKVEKKQAVKSTESNVQTNEQKQSVEKKSCSNPSCEKKCGAAEKKEESKK